MMWRVLNHYTVVRDNKGKSAKYEATQENRVILLTRKMAQFLPHIAHRHFFISYNSPHGELWYKIMLFLVILAQLY